MATGTLVFGFQTQIKNVLDPVANTDAATKEYVDNAIAGGSGGSLGAKGNNFDIQYNNSNSLAGSDNFTFDYGNTILALSGNGTANLGNLVIANYFTGTFANGDSNISIASNGNITFNSNGTGNVLIVTDSGIVTGNANISNISSASANVGTLNAGIANITNNTDSSSTTSGVLVVAGGVGVGGNIYSNGITTTSANITGNTLTLNGANIAVSNGIAGIFNLGISNINIGLGSNNITLGSSSGNIVLKGNVSTSNISSNGTAMLNTVIANSVSLTSIVNSGSNLAVTSNTIIDQFPLSTYRTAKYIITAKNSDGYQSVEVLLIHDNTMSYITIYGEITTSNNNIDIVSLSSNVSSGNICLYGTGGNTGTTLNYIATYVTD